MNSNKEQLIREKEQRLAELQKKLREAEKSRKRKNDRIIKGGEIPKKKKSKVIEYKDKNVDLNSLAKDIENWFKSEGYVTQISCQQDKYLVQATKTGWFRTIIASSRAFNVLIEGSPNNFTVTLGAGAWINNLAVVGVAAVLTCGLIFFAVGGAALWAKKIQNDVFKYIDQRAIFGEKYVDINHNSNDTYQQHSVGANEKIREAKIKLKNKLKNLEDAVSSEILSEEEKGIKQKKFEGEYRVFKKSENLKEARRKGVLTEEEFKNKEKEINNEL